MTNSMTSNKGYYKIGFLVIFSFILLQAYPKDLKPGLEFDALKAKFPDNPIVTVLQKRDVTILPDEKGVPVTRITDTQVEMILSDNGADLSESKEYFNSKTDVKKFEAYSLIPDENKYKRLDVKDLKKSSDFGDNLFYDDTYCYAFNFPATGKGVKRITYCEMEITDPYYPFMFFFAANIPVDQAELTITMPENIRINFKLFGADTTSILSSKIVKGKMVTYHWNSHQPKIFHSDELTPATRYFRPHLIVNIASCSDKTGTSRYIGTLDDLYNWIGQKTGELNKTISPEITQMTDSVTFGITDTTEKIRAIYKWVQNNIKYIAIEDGDNGYVPREASLVLKRRYGDCKDKSSLLTAMISSTGQTASVVTVGTRSLPYKYSQFPSIACADHMVALWWNKDRPMILDGTSRHNKLEEVPAFIQGKESVIRTKDGKYQVYEIPVADMDENFQNDTVRFSIENDLIRGTGSSKIEGERKVLIIGQLENKEKDKQMEAWPAAIFTASDKLQVIDLKLSDFNNVNIQLSGDYQFVLPDYITRQDKQIFVNMNLERDLLQWEVKADRVLAVEVDFKRKHQINYRLKIPENMQVAFLPKPASFNNPLFGFSQEYVQSGDEIRLKTVIYLNTLLIEGKDIVVFREMLENLKKAYRQTIALTGK